ncbi:MAG TPA: hypothetical protein VKL40_14535, partial [Candidatus Angelobacter sp.]|nr:hypothetical protein [Candidatus Angelobacter sp.]
MKPMRLFGLMVAVLHLLCVVTLFPHISADGKPSVQFNADHAVPRQVDESVQQAIARDYSAAWQALGAAMATNSPGVLNENFVGLALDKLTRRIRDQESLGLRTRIIDRGHKVEAIFYSIDGSAMELKD